MDEEERASSPRLCLTSPLRGGVEDVNFYSSHEEVLDSVVSDVDEDEYMDCGMDSEYDYDSEDDGSDNEEVPAGGNMMEIEAGIQCNHCGFIGDEFEVLMTHLQNIHRKYECDICGYNSPSDI